MERLTKLLCLLPLILLAIVVSGCPRSEATPAPQPAPVRATLVTTQGLDEPATSPTPTATPVQQAAPQAPVQTTLVPTQGLDEPATSPTPTATPVPQATIHQATPVPTQGSDEPTPTPTPIQRPPGYLHGAEYGIAITQSTSRPSQTRDGWVDITLDIAVTRFGPDARKASLIEYELKEDSICFENSTPPNDCVIVAWGSQEQFTAAFRYEGGHGPQGVPIGSTLLLPLTFEVASNATQASLFFEEHKVPVDLQGSSVPIERYDIPVAVPQAANQDLLMSGLPGIAVLSVYTGPNPSQATLNDVEIIVVMSTIVDELRLSVLTSGPSEEACFSSGSGEECISVRWGTEGRHYKALTTFTPVERLRQAALRFQVPNGTEGVTLAFGQRQIPLDLKGMVTDLTPSIHELIYPELEAGSVLYDVNRKRVVLEAIEHSFVTGDVNLRLGVTNNSEATDFSPVVTLNASRVSASGIIFDGHPSSDSDGWDPLVIRTQGQKLPPGGSGRIDIPLPRRALEEWGDTPYVLEPAERPDAVVLRLSVSDQEVEEETPSVSDPAFVSFERYANEDRFWLPDLVVASIEWEPDFPMIGDIVTFTVTIKNQGIVSSKFSEVDYYIDDSGSIHTDDEVGRMDANGSEIETFTWRASSGTHRIRAVADSKGEVREADESNNELTVVIESPSFASVSAGAWHNCGVMTGGSVVCWGGNLYGQASPPDGSFASVSAGAWHNCGVKTGGSVVCWGRNHYGQAKPPDGSFASVDAGALHTCGVSSDGTAVCWGNNEVGEVTPPGASFASVSAGTHYTCGVTSSGAAVCWGHNEFGQATPPNGSFASVSAGGWYTCGVRSDGAAVCWGHAATPPDGPFASVSAHTYYACGVTPSGAADCWGNNDYSQASPPDGSFTFISAGFRHACGVTPSGTVICWGDNEYGQATPP